MSDGCILEHLLPLDNETCFDTPELLESSKEILEDINALIEKHYQILWKKQQDKIFRKLLTLLKPNYPGFDSNKYDKEYKHRVQGLQNKILKLPKRRIKKHPWIHLK